MRDPAGNPIGGLGTNEVVWHTDQSYLARPVTGAMLYCVETPPDAGRTSWANLILAYEGLPDKTKQRIENRSEEHTSELQSLMRISYAVFCLKKKKKCITKTKKNTNNTNTNRLIK